jgi:hypothetical protein
MTSKIPDDVWNAISAAGRIDESCRPEIEGHIAEYKIATARIRASRPTEREAEQVRAAAIKLKSLVQRLMKNEQYLTTGVGSWVHEQKQRTAPPNLVLLQQTIANATDLEAEMNTALFRFEHIKDFRPVPPLRTLIYWSLQIQAGFLKRPLPTSTRETVASGKFRDYVDTIASFVTKGKVTQRVIDIEVTACIDDFRFEHELALNPTIGS